MAFLIIVFYLFGLLFGIYLGRTLGYDKFHDEVFLKICSHVHGRLDAIEVRLQDNDYVSMKDNGIDLGRVDAYQGLMDYMNNEFNFTEEEK